MDNDAEILEQKTDTGAGGGGDDVGGGGGAETALLEESSGAEIAELETQERTESAETRGEVEPAEQATREEPEIAEFKGTVAARLRNAVKVAPELGEVFKKYPKLEEQIAAVFRRESAMRDVFPTVAEARQMREQFPNGIADVQEILNEVKELDELDRSFDTRDAEGKYPGHTKLVENFFARDKDTAVALLREIPKHWYRLDPDSYNEVMGQIVAATFMRRGIPEFVTELKEIAKKEENETLASGLEKLERWIATYTTERKPSAEDDRLKSDRAALARDRATTTKAEGERFYTLFVNESRKVQLDILNAHPAIKRLAAATTITPEKRNDIIEKVRTAIKQFLAKSPSFMNKLRPLYNARNLEETLKLQRAAWAQPWVLNTWVRRVMNKEIPQMVSTNREAAARRAGTPQRRVTPGSTGDQRSKAPTGPYKGDDGRWHKKDGTAFTTQEIVAGKHLQTS